jgi:hypothetical protein
MNKAIESAKGVKSSNASKQSGKKRKPAKITVEYYRTKNGKESYRIVSPNSNVTNGPGEGYERMSGAIHNFVSLAKNLRSGNFKITGVDEFTAEKMMREICDVI